ncbi:hypothetical protein [Opitutus sp. GAS368]|uniref:hypothetical protein n=1 Tax=Opitutus sp. GAS368 TaxID=1882749 RepID=UPI00087BABC8|nr:hypothetical protein [Opitutus sp. GAS368]SDS54955.1 hypothetical protein SAMN05444173_3227 [Opitutus sp. GAS368]
MKTNFSSARRGSAFITVMMFCTILLLLIASVLKYSTYERRLNNRAKLLMEARGAGEGISEYGIAQVKKILESNRQFTDSVWSASDQALFVPGGAYAGAVTMPPDSFWGGGHIVNSTGSSTEVPLMHIGKILDTSAGGLYYVDPTNPDNDNDPLKGKRVFRYDLDILSRATAVDSFGSGNVTKYMQQTFSIRACPLFANAVYYNMDLEVQPGPNFILTGSTHTNQRLFARSASASPTAITFAGPVTAVKGFWTNFQNTNLMPFFQSINDSGALQTNATTGIVQILQAGTTTLVPMQLAAATTGFSPNLPANTWVESTWNLAPAGETWQQHIGDGGITPTATIASKANFANWIKQNIKGNLLTEVNGLTAVNLQGIPDYSYTYGSVYPDPATGTTDAAYTYISGGNDINNSAHGLIEPPRLTTAPSYIKAVEDIKYSRNAALYIVANTTQATAVGHMPDGTTINVGARSYRAFINDTTTPSAPVITEVILPGQKTYGDSNTTVDATTNPTHSAHSLAMPIVQMLNINYTTGVESANSAANQRRMTDMRRVEGGDLTSPATNADTTFIHSTARSTTNQYVPKNLYMIDLDMMELKKAVQTMSVTTGTAFTTTASDFFATGLPTTANVVTTPTHIYAATPAGINVTLNDTTRIITTASAITNGCTTAIWNGAVYVESIAAQQFDTTGSTVAIRKARTHELHNSGVRLVNGRGHVASTTLTPGFTLATNDVVYVLGTFNADGLPSTPATVAVTVPAVPGDSTGHNYEPGEVPASIAADAVVLLSQPVFTSATVQANGWNDALSGNRKSASNWNTNWATTAPSSTNRTDGINTSTALYTVPYDASNGTLATTSQQKLVPSFSEYSVAILCGLVPTGKNGVNQTSGGLHNFPRFLETWSGVECRIRGSMVALFECRVGNDPWNLRTYDPPNRVWGFNLLFNTGVMPPLTPKTIAFRRSMANDITKTVYNTKLTSWGYTPLP